MSRILKIAEKYEKLIKQAQDPGYAFTALKQLVGNLYNAPKGPDEQKYVQEISGLIEALESRNLPEPQLQHIGGYIQSIYANLKNLTMRHTPVKTNEDYGLLAAVGQLQKAVADATPLIVQYYSQVKKDEGSPRTPQAPVGGGVVQQQPSTTDRKPESSDENNYAEQYYSYLNNVYQYLVARNPGLEDDTSFQILRNGLFNKPTPESEIELKSRKNEAQKEYIDFITQKRLNYSRYKSDGSEY